MAYVKHKDFNKTTQSDKDLRKFYKAFEISSNPKYDGYKRGLASMAFKFFDKKTPDGAIKSMPNEQLAKELHKPIKKKEKYILLLKKIFGVLI